MQNLEVFFQLYVNFHKNMNYHLMSIHPRNGDFKSLFISVYLPNVKNDSDNETNEPVVYVARFLNLCVCVCVS